MKSQLPLSLWIGCVLLIAGSCIGAGMLGLPIVTGIAGFFPSLVMFFIAWLFMTITGLLLVEVISSFHTRVNIVSMSERALGNFGKLIAWVMYLFLFYSILVAYISGSGQLINHYLFRISSTNLPSWLGAVMFTCFFGAVAYQGTKVVDYCNRVFMIGKIVSYLGVIFLGLYYVDFNKLMYQQPKLSFFSLPLLVIAFGYHNMIPTLMTYVKNDARQLKKIILTGSLFALIVYVIWEIIVLGILPVNGPGGIIENLTRGRQASQAIMEIIGNTWVSYFTQALAFFALISSFLVQTLALIHFLADGLKMNKEKNETIPLCILALLPPLIFALIYPNLFIKALNFAGGICTVILFGILPVVLAWKNRYLHKKQGTYQVPGGKKTLVFIILIAVSIVILQIGNMLHLISYV